MFKIFGQTISYYQILTFIMLFGAAIYLGIKSKKTGQKKTEFNDTVAKNLGWNVYYNTPVNFKYDYIFSHTDAASFIRNTMFFEGQNNPSTYFRLIPFYIGLRSDYMLKYILWPEYYFLAAELTGITNKTFDFAIISSSSHDKSSYKQYKQIRIDNYEFNNKFVVYSLKPDGSFEGLSSDAITKLLIFLELNFDKQLAIEVKKEAALIVGNYKQFGRYMASQVNKVKTQEQILTDFLNNFSEILKIFQN